MTPIDEAFGLLLFKAHVTSKKTKRLEEIGRALREAIDAKQSEWEDEADYKPTAALHTTDSGISARPTHNEGPLTNATLEAYKKIIDDELESRSGTGGHPPGHGVLGDHPKRMQRVDLGTLRRHGANTTEFENRGPNVRVMGVNDVGHGGSKFKTLPEPKGGRVKRKKREAGESGKYLNRRPGEKFYNPGEDSLPSVQSLRDDILSPELTEEHGTVPPLDVQPRGALQPNKVSGTGSYIYSREKHPPPPPESQPPPQPESEQPLHVSHVSRPGTIGVTRETQQFPKSWPWVKERD